MEIKPKPGPGLERPRVALAQAQSESMGWARAGPRPDRPDRPDRPRLILTLISKAAMTASDHANTDYLQVY